jgi:polysaccharide pyruvyl transferase WcaK-like protein
MVPVLVAMEQLDARACADVAARLGTGHAPRIVARGGATLQQVLQTLAGARCIVSTRFHAALVGLAHRVPVFGIAIDERIPRLLQDAHGEGWHAHAREPDLAAHAIAALEPVLASPARRADYAALCAHHTSLQCLVFATMPAHLGLDG